MASATGGSDAGRDGGRRLSLAVPCVGLVVLLEEKAHKWMNLVSGGGEIITNCVVGEKRAFQRHGTPFFGVASLGQQIGIALALLCAARGAHTLPNTVNPALVLLAGRCCSQRARCSIQMDVTNGLPEDVTFVPCERARAQTLALHKHSVAMSAGYTFSVLHQLKLMKKREAGIVASKPQAVMIICFIYM